MTGRAEENCDFQVVSSKKSKRNKSRKTKESYDPFDYNIKRIESLKQELEASEYFSNLTNQITKSLSTSSQGINQIICYGLGNFSDSLPSKYQLTLLLLLQHHFKCNVLIYDPIFNDLELELIKVFNLELISTNEECKREINQTTLVFMPRCPIQLINNLLFANWSADRLRNIFLVSNSIGKIIESNTDNFLRSNLAFIFAVQDFLEEVLIETYSYNDVFNDTSLHCFVDNKLTRAGDDTWNLKSVEPQYSECNFETTK